MEPVHTAVLRWRGRIAPTRRALAFLSCAALSFASCASDNPHSQEARGAVIGGIGGAVIGHQLDSDRGRFIGAMIGAITGASVGRYQDAQQRELEAALSRERRARQIEIRRLEDETLRVSLSAESTFDFDSAVLKPPFYRALDKLADSMGRYDRTMLHIVGHTDSIGDEDYNYALSIRRAQEVAQYLMLRGVLAQRLRIEGRGESQPRASNRLEEGRRANRRVEIYIKPIVEGREERALAPPAPA